MFECKPEHFTKLKVNHNQEIMNISGAEISSQVWLDVCHYYVNL